MQRVKPFLLACGIILLAFSSTAPGLAARELSAPAAQTPGSTYVVQAGDTLSSIAYRAYGNTAGWACIWNANRWIVNPNYLLPGWTITIPPSGSCGGGTAATATPAPPAATATPAPPAATATPQVSQPIATPPATGGSYVVQAGDTLSTIAYRYYGSAAAWACIWAANPWIPNPNYIQAGWVLTIPASCGSGGGSGTPTPSPTRHHTVQAGETLSSIACYYYSDCNYWRIYNANRNVITYPGYIQPGWVLVIP